MSTRVVVTGIGLVSPVGNDTTSTWEALLAGKSGVAPISYFDTADYATKIAAEVKDFDVTQYMDRKEARRNDRFVHYAMGASKQALADSGLELTEELRDDFGVIIGSGIGGMNSCQDQFRILFEKGPDRVSPFYITQFISDIAAGVVSMAVQARGPNFATVSACATGAHAIGEASEMIRRGDATIMLAGGAEAGITPLGVAAFSQMKALSRRNDDPTAASRPFDAERDGFIMGDGAGILLLEDEGHARARGAHIYAELVGYAGNADAYHITEPAPGGEGLARCMRRALEKAKLTPADVSYINAHGTSTYFNDKNETAAIHTVFGDSAKKTPVSSTKSMTGHMLGAAGGLEAAVSVLSITHSVMPPTINLTHLDPECDLDYVPLTAREGKVNVAMSNSMGFGGHNAVLIFRKFAG
ncbi:MAG TPA: beta-ketoacyl-ACP synthase II [Ktedonobacterales bacterium]